MPLPAKVSVHRTAIWWISDHLYDRITQHDPAPIHKLSNKHVLCSLQPARPLFFPALAPLPRLLLLLLFGFQSRKVNVPEENAFKDDGEKDNQEDGEQNGLIVQDSDGLGRGANRSEPVELAHLCNFRGCGVGRWLSRAKDARGIFAIVITGNRWSVVYRRTGQEASKSFSDGCGGMDSD
ncbi:hypothetical protein LZ32DRAFT_296130 [Colletotrichum eremochloae]|nr:hypothetical protein LZ32DRAFT_296130 [Colletotrichum eremochloae]